LWVALTAPFLTILLFNGALHSWDVTSFHNWKRCLIAGSAGALKPCTPEAINYPTVGLWTSAGALRTLELVFNQPRASSLYFQLYLGVIDSLNVLLVYLLMRGLGVKRATWLTLLFALLPSTRVGGNLWAQIDGVSQFFLSLGFLCGLRGLKAAERERDGKTVRYLASLSLCIGCAAETKQLVFFSLPALAILWGVLAIRATRICSLQSIFATCLLPLLLTLYIDQLSPTPSGYLGSSLLYVLSTGSNHGSIISASGLNMYPLFHLPSSQSSKAAYALFSVGGHTIKIIPFYFGVTLFLSACTLSAWWMSKFARGFAECSAKQVTAGALLLAALWNLYMNTALSGTHERYLYHYGFFVFPVICLWVQSRVLPPIVGLASLCHLTIYGVFVLYVLTGNQLSAGSNLVQAVVATLNVLFSMYSLHALKRSSARRA
jgi:hypothetical protein